MELSTAITEQPDSQEKDEIILSPLREDIHLFSGPPADDGSPSWTLHDPVRNLFYRIGWQEFEILSRWEQQDASIVVKSVNNETTLNIDESKVEAFYRFLVLNQLIKVTGEKARERLEEIKSSRKRSLFTWLLHNYLFIRIPLCRPDSFLKTTYPFIKFVFTQQFRILILIIAIFGIYLVSRQWTHFAGSFDYFFSWQGALIFSISLVLTKIIHELGHAFSAVRYGVRIPTMGIAFLVMWPVLYTDTTDAWKLPEKRKRLIIAASGMMAELMLAIIATFIWSFLPDGALRNAILLVATSTWILTIFVNLNPFMRFDGYYLLSDYLEVQNLQERSFALAKSRLRYWLFGVNDDYSDDGDNKKNTILIAYAFSTWIYRFFLFLGIALLVYYFFFKLLGLFLMLTEVVWFIVKPVYNEIVQWVKLKEKMSLNKHSITSLMAVIIFIMALIIPWKTSIILPAVMTSYKTFNIYPPDKARIIEINVKNGDAIKSGQQLFALESPDLDYRSKSLSNQITTIRHQLDNSVANLATREFSDVLQKRLSSAITEYRGLAELKNKLVIKSTIDGKLFGVPASVRKGMWINKNFNLGKVVNYSQYKIIAYIPEDRLLRINEQSIAVFLPDNNPGVEYPVQITQIEQGNIKELKALYLGSVYGGDIAVNIDRNNKLIPVESHYRILLKPEKKIVDFVHEVKGIVKVSGQSESLLEGMWRSVSSTIIRESSF